jgi:hypothetical protein
LTSPNRVGVVDGGKDQHGRASRGGVGGNGALPVGQSNAHYITNLPKAEHDAKEWQAAMEALLLVAERDGDRVRLVTRVGYNWTDHPLIWHPLLQANEAVLMSFLAPANIKPVGANRRV